MEFTSQILFEQWKLGPEEEEFTLMHIDMEGTDKVNGKPVKISYHLYDSYNKTDKTSSMSRCTGYTCNAVVHLLANKTFNKKGVFAVRMGFCTIKKQRKKGKKGKNPRLKIVKELLEILYNT